MIIGKNIDLRLVEIEDAEFILSLRLDPELSKYLSAVEDNLEKQKEWIKKAKLNDQEWYFIVQNKNLEPVGTIRIYDINEDIFCWGSWIIKSEARKYATIESIFLLYQFAFLELAFNKTNFDVRRNNKKALDFYLRFGASIFDENDLDFFMTYAKTTFLERQEEYLSVINKIKQE